MIRRPPRSTLDRSSAASDVYKRQGLPATTRIEARGNRITMIADGKSETIQVDDTLAFVESVSYTHLRAHETVLDLVCRLLLEKKKKEK